VSEAERHPFPYLEEVIDDRLRLLDPTAVPPKPKPSGLGAGMGGPGGLDMSDPRVQDLIRQFQQQQQQQNKGGAPK